MPGASQAESRRGERAVPGAHVVLTTAGKEFAGTAAHLSYTGVLALLDLIDIPVGTEVAVHLSSDPLVELELVVPGRVAHARRCDAGITAHAVQLQYPVERIDEVMAFIEFLQKFHSNRRDTIISGPLDATGPASLIDMFVGTCPRGTVTLKRGSDEGRIVFSENYLLRCNAGMVTGVKALARMFRWADGRFDLCGEIQLGGAAPDPQPFDAAMMMASVQLDEMARIGFDLLERNDGFRVTSGIDRKELQGLERRVFDFAADGFGVQAIADMISEPDADIAKALQALIERGAIERVG